jgi:hypothetical protein
MLFAHRLTDWPCMFWMWQLDAPGPILVKHIVDQAARLMAGLHQLPTNKVLELPDFTIGLKPKMRMIEQLLVESAGRLQMVLLHGMAGMGKTTLAKAVFNQLHQRDDTVPCHFARLNPEMKHSSDMVPAQQALLEQLAPYADVPECFTAAEGRQLLEASLRGTTVLLVVDNVWGQQLSWLLPGNIMEVLGEGSMVLVTSRGLLGETSRESGLYEGQAWVREVEMDFLTQQESLELFCRHVYGSSTCPPGDKEPVHAIVRRCGELPLTLEVVGRYLSRSNDVWGFFDSLEDELSFVYNNERAVRSERQQTVCDAISISWEALDGEQQEALLDIVWFLQGQPLQLVESVCERGVLDRLRCLGLVSWPPVEVACSSPHQPVSVHPVLEDFCKLLARGDHGMRFELLGEAAEGYSMENILSMVRVWFYGTLTHRVAYYHMYCWLQVSEAKGLWLRGWQLLWCDSAALSSPSALNELRVLQMEFSTSGEQLCLSLPSLRWLWLEGAAALQAHLPHWSLHMNVSWHAMRALGLDATSAAMLNW